jgi:two-component system, LytTR family, response regulator LytT
VETQSKRSNLTVVDYAPRAQNRQSNPDDLLTRPTAPAGKTSFLVFKQNKYFTVPTENIAFFYVKYDSSIIVCFDRQEYFLNHSLEHIQNLLTDKQFFRLNRQYLINFRAIKEVEHYFARKLLVNLAVAVKDKLLVSKEKVSCFLEWLDNR